jgi:GGDEF domain-containing protein
VGEQKGKIKRNAIKAILPLRRSLLGVRRMISIRDTLNELEDCHRTRAIALECYLAAIRNMAHYAIELDDEITEPYRKYVSALAGEMAEAPPEALVESRATLRGLLRDYHDKGAKYLSGLRDELAGAAAALQETLDSLMLADGDHEGRLRSALGRLRDASRLPDQDAMRAAVLSTADTIEQSLELIRKQHQLTVAQFLSEIRVLHKRIDALQTAATIDSLTKLFNRREMEERIRSAPPGSFSLLLVKVRGFRLASMQFSEDVSAELAGAFTKRLRNGLPLETAIGRWSEEEFIAILPAARPEALGRAKWIAEHLAGVYACLKSGKTVRPSLEVTVGVVDSEPGDSAELILQRVGESLTGD